MTRSSSSPTRTSRCSTTSAASPTTRSTTKPASPNAAAESRPRSIPSTRRCAATRATTFPACPGIGEKTAAKLVTTYGSSKGSSSTSRSCRPSNARTSARRRTGCSRTARCRSSTATSRSASSPSDLELGPFDAERVRVLFNQLEFRTLLPRILDAFGDTADAAPRARRRKCSRSTVLRRTRRPTPRSRSLQSTANDGGPVAVEPRWAGAARAQ